MEGEDCVSQLFEYLKEIKGVLKGIIFLSKPVIDGCALKLIANAGSCFDSLNILKNLAVDQTT